MDFAYLVAACLLQGGLGLFASIGMVHAYQLESYHLPQYCRWVREHRTALWRRSAGCFAAMLVIQCVLAAVMTWLAAPEWFLGVLALGAAAPWVVDFLLGRKRPAKKPLVYTARIKRFLLGLGLVLFAVSLGASLLLRFVIPSQWALSAAGWLVFLCIPFWVLAAGRIMEPLEDAVKRHYYRDAQRRLREMPGLIRIGITGSYGKTSCKVILGAILSEKFRTFITPHSYNTPMGVTRAVREMMPPDTQVFVAEMGARHVGDIREMCDLVSPVMGLITSVGPQHMETFHTLENIAATKYELIESLPQGGFCAFPAENPYCLQMYLRTQDREKVLFGIQRPEGAPELSIWAEDIAVGPQGATFALVDAAGQRADCRSQLLGRHNITNILGCAAMARHLGMTLEEIARGIAKAPPVEHRLQLLPTGNGVTVIDDAFNASPDGTRAALEVLAGFPGRKIIVTPGLVELGDREEPENEDFGRRMASVVDLAILVARNGEAMERGLLQAGYPREQIVRVPSLAEASVVLGRTTRIGDVVLFENDLPDHYEG